jgi:predicted enzyme related to lactoylglutathione lyase
LAPEIEMKSNPVGWFEIFVQDMESACRFNEAVLQIKLERRPGTDMEMRRCGDVEMWRCGASPDLSKGAVLGRIQYPG